MKNLYLLILLVLILRNANAQGTWTPTTATPVADRYDDVFFLNQDTGWAVSLYYNFSAYGYNSPGQILKTTNGGATWIQTNTSPTAAYRDIAFLNAQVGFAGTLWTNTQTDTAIMYQSTDGGLNWSPVTNLPGPRPAGVCGMRALNDSTLFAVGRYPGPAHLYKTTNSGATWSYTDLDSLAGGLVDVFFLNPDTGFIVGTSDSNWETANGVVLRTTNGGINWAKVKTTDHPDEMCWKMSFPTPSIGYITIESFRSEPDSQFCLKTYDGGKTWNEVYLATMGGYFTYSGNWFDEEGIGFINENVGWIGGRASDTSRVYKTEDGGATWKIEKWGRSLNRFRWLGNGTAYFSGGTIYKFQCDNSPMFDTVKLCPQQTIAIDGQVYSQPGNYLLPGAPYLCDSFVNLNISSVVPYVPAIEDSSGILSAGNYSTYQWYKNDTILVGDTLPDLHPNANGSYTVQITDSNGCRVMSRQYSLQCFGAETVDSAFACPGQPLLFMGHTYSQPGIYQVLNVPLICDSFMELVFDTFNVQVPVIHDSAGILYTQNSFTTYAWYVEGFPLPQFTTSSFIPNEIGTYTVQVSDSNNCTLTSAALTINTLINVNGVINVEPTSFCVYPDPANDMLFVTGLPENTNLHITNMLGQIVISVKSKSQTTELDISQLPSGVYCLNNRRFVKQ